VRLPNRIVGLFGFAAVLATNASALRANPVPGESGLVGLWRAKQRFGPELRGALTIERREGSWSAEIAGRTAPVRMEGDRLSFDLPSGEGSFRGRLRKAGIAGHWIQPRTITGGAAYASPVWLESRRPGRWRGLVMPLEDEMTFYLPIVANADGTLSAFLRNPERNAGRFLSVEHVLFDGRSVKLLGRRSKDAPETTVAEGPYDAESKTFSVSLRGATYDFTRASAADEACFFPRGKAPAPYAYRTPSEEDDGWPVATPENVGISRSAIASFVQKLIDTPIDSLHSSDIHGVLIARHGKLVLEEYFHGFHREQLHDLRSAAKSLTSALTGAAAMHGWIRPSTPVYEAMAATALANLDPRRRSVTVENLLTMSSGLNCDDSDPDSPGNEDTMQEQTAQPDWYRYTLELAMVRTPGERAVYCSCNPNLLGGVLGRATGRWLPELFEDLIAQPLQIRSYAMNLTPTGDAYMGGGVQLRPRDFMKLGQVMLDGGRWKSSRVVASDWARKSVSPLYELRGLHYGYLWWVIEYPYQDHKVRAFFAGGNGGQIVMGIPELDLVIAFYGGNYSDPVLFVPQRVYVPDLILPAVN
jgi:CubicO group peptidase (beta-lactamase class C family)